MLTSHALLLQPSDACEHVLLAANGPDKKSRLNAEGGGRERSHARGCGWLCGRARMPSGEQKPGASAAGPSRTLRGPRVAAPKLAA